MSDTARRRPTIPLERMPLDQALACVDPFETAVPEELARLVASATCSTRKQGAVVLRQGEAPDGVYVVLRGRVHLVSNLGGDRELILFSLGPGEIFGESCAFDDREMTLSALVAVQAHLVKIPVSAVRAWVGERPEVLGRFARLVHDRLRDAEAVASGLALCDVEQRLRKTLARLVARQGRRAVTCEGWVLAPVPTQTELARMVGSCRETVSRTLSAFAREGLLSARGRRLVLSDQFLAGAT